MMAGKSLAAKSLASSADDRPTQGDSRMARWEKGWAQRYGIGPGNAIVQMQSGDKTGRLVVPARHREDTGQGRLRSFSHTFFSDDQGKTWRLGGTIGLNTSECLP